MRSYGVWLYVALATMVAITPGTTGAQPLAGPVPGSPYKMSTTIPSSIPIPSQVETRLGTLNFFDGFPAQATVEKLYDNLDFQRAVQAYLLALPAVNQAAMRKGVTQWGPANSTVVIWEQLLDSRTVTLTGNNNTPYSFMWIDLSHGPLVVAWRHERQRLGGSTL